MNEAVKSPIILILTRYFGRDKIVHNSTEIDEVGQLNSLVEVLNKNVKSNIDNKVFSYTGNSITEFFILFKHHFKDTYSCRISKEFNGKLRRFPDSSIFFYHHWFDNQIEHGDENYLILKYIQQLLQQIIVILTGKNSDEELEKYDFYIFLHEGDLLKDQSGAVCTFDKIPCFKKFIRKSYNLKSINSFSHDLGYPIWDKILNNRDIIDTLKTSSTKELDLLKIVLPEKIDEDFNIFLSK